MKFLSGRTTGLLLLAAWTLFSGTGQADDAEDLTVMLHEFLAGVDERAVHERFWADDLVYTSSRGTRTTKAGILAGFDGAGSDAGESGSVYGAEDIAVSLFGKTAIVTFRLVATGEDGRQQSYLNTGTFLQRDGRWQAVAWQATRIQDEE